MAFLEELRTWLSASHGVIRSPSQSTEVIDLAWYRNLLLTTLDVIATEDDLPPGSRDRRGYHARRESAAERASLVQRLHTNWSHNGVLARFVTRARAALREGLGVGADADTMRTLVAQTLLIALGRRPADLSTVERLELTRLAQGLRPESDAVKWRAVDRYARELGLIRIDGDVWAVTALGKTFLDLSGRDAVRWLLTVEVLSSTGPDDEFRTCREVFLRLTQRPRFDWPRELDDWPYSATHVYRLGELGVLNIDESRGEEDISLRNDWAPIVRELADAELTPFAALAETLLAQESASTLRGDHVPTQGDRDAEMLAAQARHTKMVVHEIRNALGPVRIALRDLYSAIGDAVPAETVSPLRALIDPGIDRVFRFAEELKQTADLSARAPTPFDPLEALREAVALVTQSLALDVELPSPAEHWHVLGDRNRFVLACVNLLRNAAQVSERPRAAVYVAMHTNPSREGLVLALDDDGPGVPMASRETIFQSGFALRPGGTGQGLALVREVVEVELRGSVRCEASAERGGARFVLVVPIFERTET